MRILPESGGGALCLLLVSVLCSAVLSLGSSVEVVGYAESIKIMNPLAFSGLRVTVECKASETKDHFVTKGSGQVDETGKFSLNIPHDIVGDDGTLKEACYAQLHSASGNLCPAHDGLEASKIVFLSKSGEKHVLGLKQKLKFSPDVCVSKFFGKTPKFPLPPPLNLPPFPKIKKPCPPKMKIPPVVIPKKPSSPKPPVHTYKPPVPIHKPPVPVHKPHVPIYKPPVPIYKPPVPIDKPSVPIYKPPVHIHKPPVPIYKPPVVIPKKPCPPKAPVPFYKPPVPIYKPPVPIYKPPVPIYKPPVVIPKKPCPPKAPLPIYKPPVVIPKKPCPPLPKLPPFPKFPPFTPKYIPHPKFGKWPPFPSHP